MMNPTMEDTSTPGYRTAGGITVSPASEPRTYANAIDTLVAALDSHRGALLTSSFEYPGRYTRWDVGFTDPVLEVTARGREFAVRALNRRGRLLLPPIATALEQLPAVAELAFDAQRIDGTVHPPAGRFAEEQRSRQPSVFSVLRALIALFSSPADPYLGLYGAFGYELAFQFEPVRRRLERDPAQRDLVLYLPDEILIVDHRRQSATVHRYEFAVDGESTAGMARDGEALDYRPAVAIERDCDHASGEYAECVRQARTAFARGDLFEVVPSQTFFAACPASPATVFTRLRARNPAPYGALMNLGEREYLVAASPEMYVRVEGRRIETCPISGTIARGRDAIEDAANIRRLLDSPKEESELTMCTDVDRNDKSRVCEPDSVRVIGRRQIEMYSRLIHTVDHVEGRLREGFDALDGFLAHAWAVTVTGAPKQHAIQFIEDHEHSPRAWYGGAIGMLGFDGNMNTGLTLRTVRVRNGVAEVRAGATLLFESDPEAEEAETRLKASALIDAVVRDDVPPPAAEPAPAALPGAGRRVLVIDHEDSFVHTLAGYFRRTGAEVVTQRWGLDGDHLEAEHPDLVLLSPGPGRPADFRLGDTLAMLLARGIPVFGVCLGLQGIIEHFGGTLGVLSTPVHGKPSTVRVLGGRLFAGLPAAFRAGRYHSLHALREPLPRELELTAETTDGVVMAVEHRTLPIAAVQFHPESIMTAEEDAGLRIAVNAMRALCAE